MKLARKFGVLLPLWGALCLALAAQSPASPAPANSSALEPVLRQMDQASAIFKSAEAEFVWYEVSTRVNRTANDDAQLILPISEEEARAEREKPVKAVPRRRTAAASGDDGQGSLF